MVSIRTLLLCSVVLLGACGQTGPLVLPSEDGNAKAKEESSPINNAARPNNNQQTTTDTATTSPAE
ncbi:MAG: lipoprotein [Zhongshania sp.]|jgi:predicted small lipoprotein YifL|nr:lipoprotein [Zhongshania sp.]